LPVRPANTLYGGGIRYLIYLLAPIVFFFSSIPPVASQSSTFPHPHPAIPARQRTCSFDRFADVSNARGSVSTGFFPLDLRALWTVPTGTKIKFPIPPKQRRNEQLHHRSPGQQDVVGNRLNSGRLFGFGSMPFVAGIG
jgi:cellulose synthase (UDP-forming)